MKRLILSLVAIVLVVSPVLGQTRYVFPDAPTDPGVGTVYQPNDVLEYKAGLWTAAPAFSPPLAGDLDAVHKMDKPGHWLFSTAQPDDIAGLLGTTAEPRDVVRYDGAGGFTPFFCGGLVLPAVPLSADVDAVFLTPGDRGDLVVSFDAPTTLGAATYDPADLVRFTRFAPGCAGWQLAGAYFSSSAAGVATSSNTVGGDERGGNALLSLDVPTDLAPSLGPATYSRGELVDWNGAVYAPDVFLAGWPQTAEVDAVSCQANPGRVYEKSTYPLLISVAVGTTAGTLDIGWSPSCSSGAEDYGIYEGSLGSWYSHAQIDCSDAAADFTETVNAASGNRYYLVVPHHSTAEGSYGVDSSTSERPPAATINACRPQQLTTACPP